MEVVRRDERVSAPCFIILWDYLARTRTMTHLWTGSSVETSHERSLVAAATGSLQKKTVVEHFIQESQFLRSTFSFYVMVFDSIAEDPSEKLRIVKVSVLRLPDGRHDPAKIRLSQDEGFEVL